MQRYKEYTYLGFPFVHFKETVSALLTSFEFLQEIEIKINNLLCFHIMNAIIHRTATWVCLCTNYQQTQSQWPQPSGLLSAMPLKRQSKQYFDQRVLPFLCFKNLIPPTAQKNHDYKSHSIHLNQMIKAVFFGNGLNKV